jgi:hypothetical protein
LKEIRLANGRGTAIVDDADYAEVSKHKWRLTSVRNGKGYASAFVKIGRTSIGMHRMLMKPPAGMVVDHINGNKLDNRRENLRLCTASQNQWNAGKRILKGTSKYKGVCRPSAPSPRPWVAQIRSDWKTILIGRYKTERLAALAYNLAARMLHGEFARLNEIPPEAAAA